MKYAVIKCVNGTYDIHSEGWKTLESAKVDFHGLCRTLWNAPDVITAYVMIANENLDKVEGYGEYIHHEPVTEETPEVESDSE